MSCSETRANLVSLIKRELSPDQAELVRAHIDTCKECAHELAGLEEILDLVNDAIPGAPPPHLRATVLGAVELDRVGPALRAAVPEVPDRLLRPRALAAVAAGRRADSRPSRLEVLMAAAAVIAILLALGGWLRIQTLEANLDEATKDADAAESQTGPLGHDMQGFVLAGTFGEVEGRLTHYRHDNYRITLDVSPFDATPPDAYYAVWLRGRGGDVGIGTFRLKSSDGFVVNFPVAVDPVDYPEVVVTLEPDDGDPRLTGRVVASGALDKDAVHHGSYEE